MILEKLIGQKLSAEQEKLLEHIVNRIPLPNQIRNIEFEKEGVVVRFEWRGHAFRITDMYFTETIEDGCLVGDNMAILMQGLLQI